MERKQLATIAHLETVARNVCEGHESITMLRGAVRRCHNVNVTQSLIRKAIIRQGGKLKFVSRATNDYATTWISK